MINKHMVYFFCSNYFQLKLLIYNYRMLCLFSIELVKINQFKEENLKVEKVW